MHPVHLREQARRLHRSGIGLTEIHRRLGISRNTVATWLYRRPQRAESSPYERCPRCARPAREIDDPVAYAYLLGQYLGDGHLLTTSRVPLLTVACDDRHHRVIHEVSTAMQSCGALTVGLQERPGSVSVRSHWNHWPCLIPQHGPGPKHLRPIRPAAWQQSIITEHPGRFVRGLIHSDGSRFVNRVTSGGRTYHYPRYTFVNESADIMELCRAALDRLYVAWRMSRRNQLSVARREAVARLDTHVGPKS